MPTKRIKDAAKILGELGNGKMANELEALADSIDALRRAVIEFKCPTCDGMGEELSGVCHCGESMADAGVFAHDNHSPVEMTRPCPTCTPLMSALEGLTNGR